jgi:type IV pilus assembly protein PilB
LHTNDSVGALVRLVDMGIDPYLINASLVGVLAQRLVRKLCSECKIEDIATPQEQSLFGVEKVFRPSGCAHCAQRGYKGRIGIFELLMISPEIRALMSGHPNKDLITALALEQGMQTLCMDGITKIQEGLVTPAELMRVLF